MRTTPRLLLATLLVACASASAIGCKSAGPPAPASFASVRIRDHTPDQIRAAAAVVFQQDGYTATDVRHAEMIFEKPGTQWERIAHGSWMDEAPVLVRVRLKVVAVANGAFELQCQAFQVRHKGEAPAEQELRLKNNRSAPYQALLDKVAGRLAR